MNNTEDMQELISRTAYEKFAIPFLRPFQLLIISSALEKGRPNMLAIMPTGSGKSLCFMLPAVLLPGITIIVYPLLSLMNDQKKRFDRLNIPSLVLRGGMDFHERQSLFVSLMSKEAKVLITNMEMLAQPHIAARLEQLDISLLVLDEAHTAVSWGNTFRPAYKSLAAVIDRIRPRRVLAFTATSDESTTQQLRKDVLGADAQVIYGGLDRENICYHRIRSVFPVLDCLSLLKDKASRPGIIFCQSRKIVEDLAERLSPYFKTYAYHAGMDKADRVRIEKDFFLSTDAVMVSTCAYGLGVDVSGLRTCIHYNLPQTAADYLQESGRIGRDGRLSNAYVLLDNSFIPTPLEQLFSQDHCLREALINAMGEEMDSSCFGCDVCDGRQIEPAGLEAVRRALRFPYLRTKESLARVLAHRKEFIALSDRMISRGIQLLIERKQICMKFGRLRYTGSKFQYR